MKKSTRHSKITGDFAEGLVLYWLSKYGYECARVDHTGIDLIARDPNTHELMGVSVKSRSRYKKTESWPVTVRRDEFDKARTACDVFKCVPYYAFVVDGDDVIRGFLVSLTHLLEIARERPDGDWDWLMARRNLSAYQTDSKVLRFELRTEACSWRANHDDLRSEVDNGA
jgi:Holliday junction resolvase-like predicted endonuclease